MTGFARQAGVAIGYVLLSWPTLAFFSANGFATIFWPASGVALAAILLGGNRFCIAIFAGAMITNLWMANHSLAASFSIALGDTFEPLLAAWLLNRAKSFDPDITRLRDFLRLVAIGLVTPSVSAVIGSTSLLFSAKLSHPAYLTALIQGWMGHALGMMFAASLILVWRKPPTDWLRRHRALEAALQLAASFLVGQVIFLDWFHEFFGRVNQGYWMYLIIALGAVRLGRHGVLVILWITLIQAMAGAATTRGFFEYDAQQSGLASLWCYLLVLYTVGMSLATIFEERSAAINKLRDSAARLEEGQRLAKFGNWEWNIETGAHSWSEEIYRIYGRDPALPPAAYPEVRQYFTPESWERLAAEKGLAEGDAYEYDAEIVRPDGSRRWITARGEATRDASGKIVNLHGTVQDITERKRAEAVFRTIAGATASTAGTSFFHETARSLGALLEADCVIIARLADGNRMHALGMQLDGKEVEHYEYALAGTPCDNVTGKGYCEYPENVSQLFASDKDLLDMGAEAYIGVPTRNKNGQVNGILCAIFRHKVTPHPMRKDVMEIIAARAGAEIERDEAAQALRESEERWNFALEGAGDGVWDWDMQTGKVVYSGRYKEMLGFPADTEWNSLGEWTDRVNPEDLSRAMVDMEKYLDGKSQLYTVEYRMLCKDGSWKWVSARGKVVSRAEDGRPLRIIGTHTDITERKQAEETIRKSRNQLSAFIQNAPVGIAMFDREMNYLATSKRWIEQFGRGHADLVGRNHYGMNPDMPAEWKAIHQQALAGNTVEIDGDMWAQANGSIHWLRWAALPWIDEYGSTGGIIIAAEDITAQKKMEMELWKQRNEMTELHKLEIASHTAAAIAHELNQPLLAVSSYNEAALMLMDSGKADPDKIRMALEKSKQQAYRAGQSLREMLNYLNSREFKSDEFDLNREIRHTVKAIKKERDTGFKTVFQLEEELPLVQANQLHIRKAISNLLHNSIEAMEGAGVPKPSITVAARTKKDANVAQMTIQDNGPGIREEISRGLFQPFRTSKSRGIGMGLAISRSLIEMNGGQLWFDPQEGPGATFHLTLPFAA